MKKILLTVITSALSFTIYAQTNQLQDLGCATVTTPQEIQDVYDFVQSGFADAKPTAGVDTIPLSIHIVGTDAGTGYYRLDDLFTVICQLNQRYQPVGFYYYIKWPITYINNSSYYEHDYWSGSNMMSQNNVPNTVNVYFVQDPNGACGYFAPSNDAVAIRKSCSGVNSTTLVHELGHFFGLPHTFYGWENGNTPSNPEKVTRGSGANCSFAGDGFCDTEADWQSDRWSCPYTGNKLDQNGQLYHPDSSIYMGYAMDACMSRFSNQQMARMNNNLDASRQNLLSVSHQPYSALSTPTLFYPTGTMYTNLKKVIWYRVPGAEYYQVKITHPTLSSLVYQEALVSDTSLTVTVNMVAGANYGVHIVPLNNANVCREKEQSQTFTFSNATTTLSVGTATTKEGNLSVAPNPAVNGMLRFQMQSMPSGSYALQLFNLSGQKMLNQEVKNNGATQTVTVPVNQLPAGMYFLHLENGGNRWVEKVMIQQ